MVLRPFIGIDWSIASIDSFTERGAGAASVTLEKLNADRTDLMLGLEFAANKTSTFSPYGRMVWRHRLDNQDDDITAFFDGNSATKFTVSAVRPADNQIDLEAGLNYAINPNLSVFAGYQGLFRDDLTSHGASAGLRFSFGAAAPIGHAPPAPPSVR
jgi:outer membrane autotransporter protein